MSRNPYQILQVRMGSLKEVLEQKICYSTFETGDGLIRCEGCKCAWYASEELRKSHEYLHLENCLVPDYNDIATLSGTQCMDLIEKTFKRRKCDGNTAAVFLRLFQYIQGLSSDEIVDESVDTGKVVEWGVTLHGCTRPWMPNNLLSTYYEQMWALPGMPQLLLYASTHSSSYIRLLKDHPKGRPLYTNDDDNYDFHLKYHLHNIFGFDTSGEEVSWFIVGFLVRTCIDGPLKATSKTDGRGTLRKSNISNAAMFRIAEIFSVTELRKSAGRALFPVPGFMLTIAEQDSEVFLEFLNMGIFGGIIEWLDDPFALEVMKKVAVMNTNLFQDTTKFDILEICLQGFGEFDNPLWPFSFDEEKDKKIHDLCIKVATTILVDSDDPAKFLEKAMKTRLEQDSPQWEDRKVMFGYRRVVLAFLHKKVANNNGVLDFILIKTWLKEWSKLKLSSYPEYAKTVMDPPVYQNWLERTKDYRKS